jgi:predicted nucleotidyltransferase
MTSTTPNLDAVREIVRRHLPSPAYHAVLFGSRTRAVARPASDWDIGITGPAPLRGAIVQRIRDELESLPTLHTFDVVDLGTVPESFRREALADAQPLT